MLISWEVRAANQKSDIWLGSFPSISAIYDNLSWTDPWNGKHSELKFPSLPHLQSLSLRACFSQNFLFLFREEENSVLIVLGTWSKYHCILKSILEIWGMWLAPLEFELLPSIPPLPFYFFVLISGHRSDVKFHS